MSISLKVEGIAGTDIKDAAKEMLRLAELLDIMIEMDFNGKQVLAMKGWDLNTIINSYYSQIEALKVR